MTTEQTPPTDDDLARLLAENEALKAQLAAPAVASRHRARRVIAALLAFLTGLLLVTSLLSVWTNRTALNTSVFVDRVAPVIEQPAVQDLVAREITTQLFDALDVEQRLQTAVPPELTFLAGPLTSGVQDFTQKQVVKLVGTEAFYSVWKQALTLSHKELVDTIEGDNAAIQVSNGQLIINVLPVINEVLKNLQDQLPSVFGRPITLPELNQATLDQILAQVEQRLGVDLPGDFGQVDLGSAADLETARTGIDVFRVSVVLLLILTLATLVIAIVVSVDRRRTVLQIALWSAGLALLVFLVVRSLLRGQVSSVQDALTQQAVREALVVLFSSLRTNITWLFWIGLVVALVLYLVGPGRFPHWLRGLVGQGAAAAGDDRVVTFVRTNRDVLQIAGAAVAALLWFLNPSWATFLILGALLVAYELGVLAIARKTPAVEAEGASEGATEGATEGAALPQ